MTLNDIRNSGLLEYYVLGLLSEEDLQKVQGYLVSFPELQDDISVIERSMQAFAVEQGITPKRNLKNDILQSVRENGRSVKASDPKRLVGQSSEQPITTTSFGGSMWKYAALVLGLVALGASYFGFQKLDQYRDLESKYHSFKSDCEGKEATLINKLSIFEELNDPNNKILKVTPTDNYLEIDLVFHSNDESKKNYVQIRNLPAIADDQAFQLWSLKGGDTAPIPLTVFKDGDNYLLEVDFESGTGTYAITIEKEGGAKSPTLSRLIGTVNV